jgi:hypothetical protein
MVHTEARCRFDSVGRIRRSDEQLARHAAHTGAGGAIGAAFDEHCRRACIPGSAVRGKACRPGTDDGDVNLCSSHGESFVVGTAVVRQARSWVMSATVVARHPELLSRCARTRR